MDVSPIRINRKRQLVVAVLLLIGMLLALENTGWDMAIQKRFFVNDHWLVDYAQPVLHFIFYDAAKKSLVLYAILILLGLVLSFVFPKLRRFRTRNNVFILICLLMVPAIVGLGKKQTNVHCPYQLQEFGGVAPYVTLFEASKTEARGRCFPAGHASGGFALLLFVMIASTRRRQFVALGGAMAMGWAMGGYQMLNGRHFLSHTLATMLIAWIIVLIVHMLLYRDYPDGPSPAQSRE